MAIIKIERTNEFLNRMRDYKIYIDGKEVGTIANGETKTFETNSGQHTLAAKIDWCASPEILININDAETKKFRVGGFKSANWLIFSGLGVLVLHFLLSETTGINYIISLLVPIFLLLGYYLTLGRKKYLTLVEITSS